MTAESGDELVVTSWADGRSDRIGIVIGAKAAVTNPNAIVVRRRIVLGTRTPDSNLNQSTMDAVLKLQARAAPEKIGWSGEHHLLRCLPVIGAFGEEARDD